MAGQNTWVHSNEAAVNKYDEAAVLLLPSRPLNFPEKCHEQAVKGRSNGGPSKFKGIHWNKGHLKWQAQIKIDGNNKSLGFFESEEDAARRYDKMAASLGRPLNFSRKRQVQAVKGGSKGGSSKFKGVHWDQSRQNRKTQMQSSSDFQTHELQSELNALEARQAAELDQLLQAKDTMVEALQAREAMVSDLQATLLRGTVGKGHGTTGIPGNGELEFDDESIPLSDQRVIQERYESQACAIEQVTRERDAASERADVLDAMVPPLEQKRYELKKVVLDIKEVLLDNGNDRFMAHHHTDKIVYHLSSYSSWCQKLYLCQVCQVERRLMRIPRVTIWHAAGSNTISSHGITRKTVQ